ncbi:MAG: glycosyltransferase [Alphaproteobacteria bacterium]|nr:glycosyltransferase [Alphaproteobacteria bacterium]
MRSVVAAALIAAALNASAWFVAHRTASPPDADTEIQSVSFSPYGPKQNPVSRDMPTAAQIARDLSLVSGVARGIRIDTTTEGMEVVPAMARKYGLNVTLGAWVDKNETRNKRELENAVELAKKNRNVRSILVGNEMIYRKDKTVDEVIAMLRQMRKRVHIPVSTGEIWNVWLANPQLVKEVDYIAVHILPYWEGVPAEHTVEYSLQRFDELRKAYPGKKIVVSEFGWPSNGYNNLAAVPDPLAEARVLREFLVEARKRGIDYNIIEAFDQPWKTMEGSVGAYWGLFDANRVPKFSFTGSVDTHDDSAMAAVSLVLGLGLTVLGLRRRHPRLGQAVVYALAANAMGAGLAMAGAYPFQYYMSAGLWIMWSLGCVMLLPLTAITLSKIDELAAVLLGHRPRRLIVPDTQKMLSGGVFPKVSIHIPAYREQPEMLKATLDSLAALDYPNFEAVVIINNTPEESYWRPIEAHCAKLGPRFKFLNLRKVNGFKAGAMNVALEYTAPDAEVLAVIDADYVVEPDWLKDLVPCFADPKVAMVQAPQDHRDGAETVLKRMMNWEYAGFFDIGMVQRNEDDAIVAHGTMLMVRRSAFEAVGGWGTDTIVEDTELGLRLFEAGYSAHYTRTRYGRGLLPDTFKAFKTQRHRWAYGAVQVFKKHWPHMKPGVEGLTPAQKFQYLTGWFYWLSDAMGALISVLNLIWVPMVLLVGVIMPTTAMTLPILAAFVINLLHSFLLYRVRVRAPLIDTLGASVAAMSLQLTVAGAVFDGFIKDGIAFNVTAKGGGAKKKNSESSARAETIMGLLLVIAATAVAALNPEHIKEQNLFAATLAIQSLPFLAAALMRTIEKVQNWHGARRAEAAAPTALAAGAVVGTVG